MGQAAPIQGYALSQLHFDTCRRCQQWSQMIHHRANTAPAEFQIGLQRCRASH